MTLENEERLELLVLRERSDRLDAQIRLLQLEKDQVTQQFAKHSTTLTEKYGKIVSVDLSSGVIVLEEKAE